jgi:hypothetical protein
MLRFVARPRPQRLGPVQRWAFSIFSYRIVYATMYAIWIAYTHLFAVIRPCSLCSGIPRNTLIFRVKHERRNTLRTMLNACPQFFGTRRSLVRITGAD